MYGLGSNNQGLDLSNNGLRQYQLLLVRWLIQVYNIFVLSFKVDFQHYIIFMCYIEVTELVDSVHKVTL